MNWIKQIRMPHVFVLLLGMILLVSLLTYIVPAGRYQREERQFGELTRSLVIDGTYECVPKDVSLRGVFFGEKDLPAGHAAPVSFVQFLSAIPRGMEKTADIIFFIFVVGGVFSVLQRTGTVLAVMRALLDWFGHSSTLLTVILMLAMAIGGSTLGMGEEFIPLVPVFLLLAQRMGFDRLYGLAIMMVAADLGFAAATTNPFTVNIAQSIAGLPLNSGIGLRIGMFVVCFVLGVIHVLRYGARVKGDPARSLVHGIPFEDGSLLPADAGGDSASTGSDGEAGSAEAAATQAEDMLNAHHFSTRQVATVVICGAIFVGILLGVQYLDWWLDKMAGGFFCMALVAAVINRLTPNEAARAFIKGLEDMVVAALVVGFARGIEVVLSDGQILDTVIHAAAHPLKGVPTWISVEGMLLFQTCLNFLIPSGSGQAAVTMPLMAPLADTLGITRQTAVLAYQCGDGFSNTIIPTSGVLMAMLALGGVPYTKWLRFIMPLFLQLMVVSAVFLVIAVVIGYQ